LPDPHSFDGGGLWLLVFVVGLDHGSKVTYTRVWWD
jgi:hypothetical protein